MAIFTNIMKQLMHTRIRQMPKILPSSSAMAENMKSCSTYGIASGDPWYSPVPNQLPAAMENRDWLIW